MRTLNLLVIADHESEYLWDFFDREKFQDIDLIVSCGDLKAQFLDFLVTMLPVPLLYVHGNHDVHYENDPPTGCVDLDAVGVYTYKGVRFVGYGGCQSASGKPWQFTERDMRRIVNSDRTNVLLHGGFDVLVTHAAASGLGDGDDSFHRGFVCFRSLIDRWKPAYHLHGHDHLSYHHDAQRYMDCGNTRIVNGFGYCRIKLELPDVERRGLFRVTRQKDC